MFPKPFSLSHSKKASLVSGKNSPPPPSHLVKLSSREMHPVCMREQPATLVGEVSGGLNPTLVTPGVARGPAALTPTPGSLLELQHLSTPPHPLGP